jgi:putative hydrolase of the HAD superfamily
MIKGILLDYGGTIDTNGLHWAHVLWEAYQHNQVNVDKDAFSQAYKYGERALALKPLVQPDHVFYDVLSLKLNEQFNFLKENGHDIDDAAIDAIARECNQFAQRIVENAKPVLGALSASYPIVMVSNFYGNIKSVLDNFGILGYFQSVVESAVVGVRKPDPQIYQLGIDALGFAANECVVIGDSFSKDIEPAMQLGCQAIWLNVAGWEDSTDQKNALKGVVEITDFANTTQVLESLREL